MENEYCKNVKDLGLNDKTKTIEEVLIDFNLQEYLLNKNIRARKN